MNNRDIVQPNNSPLADFNPANAGKSMQSKSLIPLNLAMALFGILLSLAQNKTINYLLCIINTMEKRQLNRILILILLLACLNGCAELAPIALIDKQTSIPQQKAVIFFVDGVNRQVYRDMLSKGQLPNIDKYLVQSGCSVNNAITTTPSITYAVTTTIVTGQTPGRHGIVGNKFFDRDKLIFADYNTIATYRDLDLDYHHPNLYEIMDNSYSTTIQTPLGRGAYRRIDNWATSGVCWFFGLYETVDRWTARRFKLIGQLAQQTQRWPKLIFSYFPATDEIGHRLGPGSPRYRNSLMNVDRQIGHICRALDHNDLLDSTYLIFLSDHGMSQRLEQNSVDLVDILTKQLGLKLTTSGPNQRKQFSKRAKYFQRYNAILANGGGRRAHLYLKNSDDWKMAASVEQLTPIADYLTANPGIFMVAYRANNGLTIQTQAGKAVIRRGQSGKNDAGCIATLNEKRYSYQVIDGDDPLGYDDEPGLAEMLEGEFHSGQVWLERTAGTKYPDLPVGIVELFDSRRAGDMVIFADDNWDFDAGHVGGHGSVAAVDMVVPMVFAGPGIRKGSTIERSRMVDVAPTIIDMIDSGKLERYQFDGRSLLGDMINED